MGANSCQHFAPQIWAAVDGESNVAAQAALAGHLRTCTACKLTLRQAVRTNRRLAEHALVPFGISALAGSSAGSSQTGTAHTGGTSALHRAKPRTSSRRTSKTSSSATPLIATGVGLLAVGLLVLALQHRPHAAPPVFAEPEVTPMPEKSVPADQPQRPAFRLALGKDSPATVVDGKVIRWGIATKSAEAPIKKHIDGFLALCLDGQTQGMQASLSGTDFSGGFALYAVVHATTTQANTPIATLIGPAGAVAALRWSPQGPEAWWSQDSNLLINPTPLNVDDRYVLAWRCTPEGTTDVVRYGGKITSGKISSNVTSQLKTVQSLAIAHGGGHHFEGNIFAIELVSPAPQTAEMHKEMHALAIDYGISDPNPTSLP